MSGRLRHAGPSPALSFQLRRVLVTFFSSPFRSFAWWRSQQSLPMVTAMWSRPISSLPMSAPRQWRIPNASVPRRRRRACGGRRRRAQRYRSTGWGRRPARLAAQVAPLSTLASGPPSRVAWYRPPRPRSPAGGCPRSTACRRRACRHRAALGHVLTHPTHVVEPAQCPPHPDQRPQYVK